MGFDFVDSSRLCSVFSIFAIYVSMVLSVWLLYCVWCFICVLIMYRHLRQSVKMCVGASVYMVVIILSVW